MDEEARDILKEGAVEIGTPLSDAQIGKFELYLDELKKWSEKAALTSLKKDVEIIVKHFLDSLTPLPQVSMGHFVLDIGSGGGLPGVPMKIARPDIKLLLLDSTGKKVAFLNHIVRQLKLKNARAIQQRAESTMFQEVMASHLDVVVARAFGKMEKILVAASPYLKTGGKLIAMKGPRWEEEKGGKSIPPKAGLKRVDVIHLNLPHLGDKRSLIIYEKV